MVLGNFKPPSEYRYVKWYISAVRTLGNYAQASEFRVTINATDVSMTGTTVTNPGGNNPSVETPPNLVDNNTATKWLNFNMASQPSTLIFDMGSAKLFNGYRWATANDSPDRDPITWIIYGSNDGINWTELHNVTNATITTSRYTFTSVYNF